MGLAKSEIFTKEQNRIAQFAKAFSHPARVAILQYLFQKNSCVCGEIVNQVGLAQATISQHLKELKILGLIKGKVEGASVCYCIDNDNWKEMKSIMRDFVDEDLRCGPNCC